jgi:hypothetical protein
MNVICIDLTILSESKLKEICKVHDLEYEAMLSNKKQKISKIWIDKEADQIIGYTLKKSEIFYFHEDYLLYLKIMDPIDPSKIEIVLNLDDILEKISQFGVESLTKEERDFLDKQ